MSIPVAWLKGLSQEERSTFEGYIRNTFNGRVLKKLREILDEKLDIVDISSHDDYTSPGWAYYQADLQGQKRAIREIRALFNFLDQERK
jgi:hypothetical protein